MRHEGVIRIEGRLLEPAHHGAGVAGNTQILRRQEVILPDGRIAMVPFISGNSLKHLLRHHGAMHMLEVLEVPPGALTKPVVDLLFSGGHLDKGAASVRLDLARQVAELVPILSVLGFSAGNWMEASKLRVSHLHFVCRENAWRLPAWLEVPEDLPRAGKLVRVEFGTRHEALRDPAIARMLAAPQRRELDLAVAERKGRAMAPKRQDSSQMIYDFEVISAGARFWGEIEFVDLDDRELVALRAALARAARGKTDDGAILYRLGAKTAVGFGLAELRFSGALRISAPDLEDSTALARVAEGADLEAYEAHLRAHREAILELLARMTQ